MAYYIGILARNDDGVQNFRGKPARVLSFGTFSVRDENYVTVDSMCTN